MLATLDAVPYWMVSVASLAGTVVSWNPTKRAYKGTATTGDWALVVGSTLLSTYSFYRTYSAWKEMHP